MSTITSQITSLTIVYSTIYSGADQSKHQSSASLAFVWGIHRGPVNSPHKWPVTRKMFPFDDVIMCRPNAINFPSQNTIDSSGICGVFIDFIMNCSVVMQICSSWVLGFHCVNMYAFIFVMGSILSVDVVLVTGVKACIDQAHNALVQLLLRASIH